MRFAAILIASVATVIMAADFPVGSKMPAIALNSPGAPPAIQTSAAKATAVIFVSTECPVSNSYNGRLAALYNDYAPKGVQLVFVNANHGESASEVEEHEHRVGWPFKVVKDADDSLANRLNAQHTPEAFVFDQSGTLVYHGRVDNSMHVEEVKRQDLRNALDAVLAGRPVAVSETRAFGCSIKRAGEQ